MAAVDVQNFRNSIQDDASLQGKVESILQQLADGRATAANEDTPADLSPLVDLAAEHGFNFTQEELRAEFYSQDELNALDRLRAGGELTDADLETVSGGFLLGKNTFLTNNPLIKTDSSTEGNSVFDTSQSSGSSQSSERTRAW